MLILFAYFVVASLLMLPLAYINGIIYKIHALVGDGSISFKIKQLLVFVILGVPILFLSLINDMIYFWRFNLMPKN